MRGLVDRIMAMEGKVGILSVSIAHFFPYGDVPEIGTRVLAQASNANGESGDCTAHAELSAIRLASPLHSRNELAVATLYSSAEPCVMCAGAIFWSAIGRVVYGIDAERLRVFRGERLDQKDAELSCRDVFQAASHAIECIGPALIEEASSSHQGAWKV
jgi:tRNA(Arg) A34 adenosine deaminase TadA